MEPGFYGFETLNYMITKEKILEILHSYSYNVEDQAGNHLIVVDDDSWDAVATEVKNCSIPDVVGQSEQLPCDECVDGQRWSPYYAKYVECDCRK